MSRLLRARASRSVTCFCDECARASRCDPEQRLAAARDAALIRLLPHR